MENETKVKEVINKGRKILVNNNWMLEKNFNDLVNNTVKINNEIETSIKDCIDKCTSPAKKDIFNAFDGLTPESTRVLILGQDPYPPNRDGSIKATGYAFLQNPEDKKRDDSLNNILLAIYQYEDTQPKRENTNNYEDYKKWTENNKVLLLNTSLTYEKHPDWNKKYENEGEKSTRKREIKELREKHQEAWKPFIQNVIKTLILSTDLVVFLWGEEAQKIFLDCINSISIEKKLLILKSTHPSNRNEDAKNKFLEDKNHFAICNEFLGNNSADWKKLCEIYKFPK